MPGESVRSLPSASFFGYGTHSSQDGDGRRTQNLLDGGAPAQVD